MRTEIAGDIGAGTSGKAEPARIQPPLRRQKYHSSGISFLTIAALKYGAAKSALILGLVFSRPHSLRNRSDITYDTRKTMSIRLRINLVLFATFIAIGAAGGWYINNIVTKQSNEYVVKQAAILMESALAVRNYTVDLVKPHLDPLLEQKFLPQTVPAFAATETFERFRKKFPNYKYKEAVLDPTNPRDLADEKERAIIDRFIKDPALQDTTGELYRNQSRFYYVARPIQIKNPACLACHDTPDRAPATMRQIYGDKGGFGWKLNQVVGAQIIVVPAYEQDAASTSMLKIIAMLYAATFVILLLVINLVLPRRDS